MAFHQVKRLRSAERAVLAAMTDAELEALCGDFNLDLSGLTELKLDCLLDDTASAELLQRVHALATETRNLFDRQRGADTSR